MTSADRLRAALDAICWSQRGLADLIGRDSRQVRRWASGQYEPPADLLAWLERVAAFHQANPPPNNH